MWFGRPVIVTRAIVAAEEMVQCPSGELRGNLQTGATCCVCRVYLKLSFYISFRHVGQDTASKSAAVINTGRCRQLSGLRGHRRVN